VYQKVGLGTHKSKAVFVRGSTQYILKNGITNPNFKTQRVAYDNSKAFLCEGFVKEATWPFNVLKV